MWFEEYVSVPVSWEGKTDEHSMCVGDCIDSDILRFYTKGVTVPIRAVTVPIRPVTVNLARKGFMDCVVYCLLPPTFVYFAVLQPALFSVYNYKYHFQLTTPGPLLICQCLQCNQSCHQFVAKHALMSFVTDFGGRGYASPLFVICCPCAYPPHLSCRWR